MLYKIVNSNWSDYLTNTIMKEESVVYFCMCSYFVLIDIQVRWITHTLKPLTVIHAYISENNLQILF